MTPAGVYLHIPFCRSRCAYCDFATGLYTATTAERYVRALVKEIENFVLPSDINDALPAASATRNPVIEIDTLYFGGGTPSLLTPAQIETLLCAAHARFEIKAGAEITLEINPGGLSLDDLKAWRALGVNRASFGAQTFNDAELARLGRRHTGADVGATFQMLRAAGFDNINFDLIAGLPAQTLLDWRENLHRALELQPEHLSLYLLEVHEGTPLAAHIARGMQPAPDDDLAAEMYEIMLDEMARAGYEHYEISNFCRAGYEARHNLKYWTRAPVYGFGCSAHSHDGANLRWANERDAARYIELIETNSTAVIEQTILTDANARAEHLFLGLRLMRGISVSDFNTRHNADLLNDYQAALVRFNAAELLSNNSDTLRLTRRGALFSNEVFTEFV